MQFSARVAVITGSGSGIGRAMATAFHREGAHVVCADLDSSRADEVAANLNSPGTQAIGVGVDISKPEEVEALRDRTLDQFGRVDILCNNAGVIDDYKPAIETTDEVWNRTIAVNLTGAFLVSRAFLPSMVTARSGVIVNTASTSSLMAGGGGVAYVASKHGILGLTRQLSLEYGARGVRVNAICPGVIDTEMTSSLAGDAESEAEVQAAITRTPAGRMGTPEEVARMATYLAGGDAEFVHGAAVVIDGGWMIAAAG